jgi:hypothetical protein
MREFEDEAKRLLTDVCGPMTSDSVRKDRRIMVAMLYLRTAYEHGRKDESDERVALLLRNIDDQSGGDDG